MIPRENEGLLVGGLGIMLHIFSYLRIPAHTSSSSQNKSKVRFPKDFSRDIKHVEAFQDCRSTRVSAKTVIASEKSLTVISEHDKHDVLKEHVTCAQKPQLHQTSTNTYKMQILTRKNFART